MRITHELVLAREGPDESLEFGVKSEVEGSRLAAINAMTVRLLDPTVAFLYVLGALASVNESELYDCVTEYAQAAAA